MVDELASNPKASELDFWHTLSSRPLTTDNDAFHGVLLYTDGDDPATTYDQRVSTLKSRGMLPADLTASRPGNRARHAGGRAGENA